MARFTVLGGRASDGLARGVAERLGGRYIGSDLRVFPDGEHKVTLGAAPGRGPAVVIQSTYPPVDSNLVQALSLVYKAGQHSSDVTAVVPYMGYARQDREFLPREIVTMEVMAGLFESAGAGRIIVVDIHSRAGLEKFRIPAENVSAVPELAGYFGRLRLKNPLVVSPDLGGAGRAEEFARLSGTDHIALRKQRNRKTGRVRIMDSGLQQVAGRDLILVDDMISTGGSIVKAAGFLKRQKCGRIYVACSHALLIDGAEEKIRAAGVTRIVSTNTVPGRTARVDVSGIIAEAVRGPDGVAANNS